MPETKMDELCIDLNAKDKMDGLSINLNARDKYGWTPFSIDLNVRDK